MLKTAIGIDLGTFNSCVAVFDDGECQIIPNDHGNLLTPSYVAFTNTGYLIGNKIIGEDAKDQILSNPTNTIFGVLRLVGRTFDNDYAYIKNDIKYWPFKVVNIEGRPKIEVMYKNELKQFFPEQIISMILKKLINTAEIHLSRPVTNAVLTVPSHFNYFQRQAIKDAAAAAGLPSVRVMNNSDAAAIAYGFRQRISIEQNILIFDLGSGTLDISIVNILDHVFEVKAVASNLHLGGEDFDNNLVEYLAQEFERKNKKNIRWNIRAMLRLKMICETAKQSLSSSFRNPIEIDSFFENIDYFTSISRSCFEELNQLLFNSTVAMVQNILHESKLSKTAIHTIVLIGGSSRIPKIQELLRNEFDNIDLSKSINPFEAVAYGAAIQAASLAGDRSPQIASLILIEVVPLNLGIEIAGDKMDPIVMANTIIPIKQTKRYTNVIENQTTVLIKIFEGKNGNTIDNSFLGNILLHGIAPAVKNEGVIEVTFSIEATHNIKVTVEDMESKRKNYCYITSVNGNIQKMEVPNKTTDVEVFCGEYNSLSKKKKQKDDEDCNIL